MKRRISVFGAGSWGTALAQSLARNGHDICLWCHREEQARAINANGYNPFYLKEYQLSSLIEATGSLKYAAEASDLWLSVTPTQFLRPLLEQLKPFHRSDVEICNASKGIEITTLKLISQIVEDVLPGTSYTVLSGPSHAEECIRNLPLALTAASMNPDAALLWQEIFNRDMFRVYTNDDVIGVEVGGAIKNVIAIASGLIHSMELGDNSRAAMVTRGLAEISKLGLGLGADLRTFAGLAGVGDLMVTAYSRHSRNFRLGEMLGQGNSLDEAVTRLGQVAEGAYTVKAVRRLAEKTGIEMPISRGVYEVLYGALTPKDVMFRLVTRSPKPEY